MTRSPRSDGTSATSRLRGLLERWKVECDEWDRSGGDPEGRPVVGVDITLLDADSAVAAWLVYAPVWPQGCPLEEDELVRAAVFVDPLDLRFATCELSDGTIVGLVAEPKEYTDGLKLEDHIAVLERDGTYETLDLSIEAHLQKRDAEKRAASLP